MELTTFSSNSLLSKILFRCLVIVGRLHQTTQPFLPGWAIWSDLVKSYLFWFCHQLSCKGLFRIWRMVVSFCPAFNCFYYKFQTTSCGRGYRSKGYAWKFAHAILLVGYPHNWRKEKSMSRFEKLSHVLWHCQYNIVLVAQYRVLTERKVISEESFLGYGVLCKYRCIWM